MAHCGSLSLNMARCGSYCP